MDRNYIEDRYRNYLTLFIYWGLSVLVVLAAGIYAWWGDWLSAVLTVLILGLMLVPSVLKGRYRLYIPFTLELWIVSFIFLTLFLGGVAHFYDRIPFWDKFLHFQSGFLLGVCGYVLIYLLNEHERVHLNLSPGFVSLFAVTFSLALGVVWEIVEFATDSIFAIQSQGVGLADTMWDLIAASLGALLMSIAGYFWMYRHKRLPFTPWPLRALRKKIDDVRKARKDSANLIQ